MNKFLLINGSPHENGNTHHALAMLADALQTASVDIDHVYLGQEPIHGCINCNKCSLIYRCSIDDSVNRILDHLDDYCCIIVGSPVYWGGPTGQLIAYLERLFVASQGRMIGKLASCIVCCDKSVASSTIDFINNYFIESGMIIIGSNYENQIYRPDRHDLNLSNIHSLAQQISTSKNIFFPN